MDFSDKVKYIRKVSNLTQVELAKKLNIAFATVNRWENKTFKPSKMAQKIIDDFCEKEKITFKGVVNDGNKTN